ncbi:glycosyl transferase family protein [Moraxella macacae 0408225]|uniref:Glycosyl transferase family protein n=1 Tax=Moraxella macacae 0408225 TaxID=1230338 RepID=L2F9Z5_9GAMM|nr:glycosyltransferase [Moraxella macacae]ELA09293.1 glycosyl transferase family protein [Moraxella macacae 0408225]
MNIKEANQLYNNGEYAKALNMYLELKKIFGDLVEPNILLCQKKLNLNANNNTVATANSAIIDKFKDKKLDSTTRILVDNQQKSLNTQDREKLLEDIAKFKKIKSANAEEKPVNPVPKEFPKDMVLSKLPESTNDFVWLKQHHYKQRTHDNVGLSVVIPTFNRSKILSVTLVSLVNQETAYPFEVIVADDGSSEDISKIVREFEQQLDIKYVRQKDYGYQLCAVRNLGVRTAKYDFVAILDCDMAANPTWVNSYLDALVECDDVAYIGPRKYIDTNDLELSQVVKDKHIFEKLPPVKSDSISTDSSDNFSKDWRLKHFADTQNLRMCDSPFRYFSGGNVAFAKKWMTKAGSFDEEFTHWGGEDNEFGYRLYRAGCFFQALDGAMAYHQEPPGKENETDRSAGQIIARQIIGQKIPYFYRKLEPIETAMMKTIPLVSIYVPAYNCQDTIIRCVDSALNQTVNDLEVCICDDGSTDDTLKLIKETYGGHPRVRFVSQTNGGIAKASNTAVKLCRGYYIGQLDSDDYLEPDAVELCLKEFFANRNLACVYTTNRNVDADGKLIANGYNWPVFSREKAITAMIFHHFRMFTARAWNLTTGFDESLQNSIDYDMFLKLSEVGEFKHLNKICYNRTLHGENTSVKKLGLQKQNHFRAVNLALQRMKIDDYTYTPTEDSDASRKFVFAKNDQESHDKV